MSKVTYNYHFVRQLKSAVLVTGGSAVGTLRSSGWLFDGQVFTRSKAHPYLGRIEPSDLKIVTVRIGGES